MLLDALKPSRPRASWGITDDRWYVRDISGYVMESGAAGVSVTADSILRCGTVLAAVRFRGDSWAMCPPATIRKTAKGREEDPGHYSQTVLRNPNKRQTGNRWRHLNGVWLATWGNAYNEIISLGQSFADELLPIHPSLITDVQERADGSLRYWYTPPAKPARWIGQESMLHFRDMSVDGISGLETYRLIRNLVGIALLAEQHASTFLRKGTRISGLLVPSGPLTKPQRDDLLTSANADLGGSNNTGALGVLPYGVDLKPLSLSNRDNQFGELSDQTIGMILRALGVPGVVVGWMGDKTATYASADAFFEKGGIKHCVLPILANVEAEEEKSLLLPGDGRQIKHNLDALQRANWKDRIAGLVQATGGPIMSVNEAREIEDYNPIDNPRFDEPHIPSNMVGGATEEPDPQEPPAGPPRRLPPPPPDGEDEDENAATQAPDPQAERLKRYEASAALRIVRREIAAIEAKAPKMARDKDSWRAFVLEFYGKHASHVSEIMLLPEPAARAYCDRQASALLAGGAKVAETWEREIPPRLVELATDAAASWRSERA